MPAEPVPLYYASPVAGRSAWGPILFWPSRLALVLLLLAAGVFCWLRIRHEPWRQTATAPFNDPFWIRGLCFNRDRLFLTWSVTAKVWDPQTGRLLSEMGDRDAHPQGVFFPLDEGQYIVQICQRGARADLFDTRTGRRLRSAMLEDRGALQDLYYQPPASPSGCLFVDRDYRLWDMSQDPPRCTGPIRLPDNCRPQRIEFTPDGRQLGVFYMQDEPVDTRLLTGDGKRPMLSLFDVATMKEVHRTPLAMLPENVHFGPDGRMVLRMSSGSFVVVSVRDGSLVLAPIPTDRFRPHVVSSDGRKLLLGEASRVKPVLSRDDLSLYDLDNGERIATVSFNPRLLAFFPGEHKFLACDYQRPDTLIFDRPRDSPLAALRTSNPRRLAISPEGDRIAADNGESIQFFQKTGWDCPESPIGMLIFPHTIALIVLAGAAILVLHRDARRARTAETSAPFWPILLAIAAFPRAIHFVLSAAMGQWLLTPAPVLVVASIGLATGSRFWRLATLVALAADLPINLYCLRLIHKAGLGASSVQWILDRQHAVPHIVPFAALALGTALLIGAIVQLARRVERAA